MSWPAWPRRFVGHDALHVPSLRQLVPAVGVGRAARGAAKLAVSSRAISARDVRGHEAFARPCHSLVWHPGGVTAQPGRVESISAVTLVTADMARAVSFYRLLGLEPVSGGPETTFTSFRAGTGYINLELRRAGPPSSAWGRVVLWVDDVDAMYRRAVAAGLAPATSPADAPWGERYFHLHDPDGHELSFARPLQAGR